MHYHRRYFIFKEFDFEDILKNIALVLRERGFIGSGQNYRKVSEKAIAVINFQKSTDGNRFFINVGVQPLMVPAENDQIPDVKNIKEYECIFRKRIDSPEKLLGWPHPMRPKCFEDMKDKIEAVCGEYIEPLLLMDNLFKGLAAEQFLRDESSRLIVVTQGRGCLHFARIALVGGDIPKARSFIECGLKLCSPRATGLHYDLEKLKKELDDKEKAG